MKKLSYITLAALAAVLFTAGTASAATSTAPGQNKLLCFDGTTDGGFGGTCTLKGNGAKGPATLDNTDGNANGSYSGVFVENSNLNGSLLKDAKQLSFSYTGTATAGSPRFSLAIDTDGDADTDMFAFVSAFHCSDGAGLVDAINDPTCTVFVGSESFPNWAALVAAHPTWRFADDFSFVIADDAGLWTVSGVKLGKPGK